MAIGSTVCKAELNIANIDTNYYETHEITIAKHPSETELRVMARLVAFIFNANERLVINQGVDNDDDPALWQKNYGGDVELWIDLAQVDEKRLRKACGRSEQVIVYLYNLGSATTWWKQNGGSYARFKNLSVRYINLDGIEKLFSRTMRIQATITDGELSLNSDAGDFQITQEVWK
jgi:uncharacterized protein YaeQ